MLGACTRKWDLLISMENNCAVHKLLCILLVSAVEHRGCTVTSAIDAGSRCVRLDSDRHVFLPNCSTRKRFVASYLFAQSVTSFFSFDDFRPDNYKFCHLLDFLNFYLL